MEYNPPNPTYKSTYPTFKSIYPAYKSIYPVWFFGKRLLGRKQNACGKIPRAQKACFLFVKLAFLAEKKRLRQDTRAQQKLEILKSAFFAEKKAPAARYSGKQSLDFAYILIHFHISPYIFNILLYMSLYIPYIFLYIPYIFPIYWHTPDQPQKRLLC